MTEKELETEVKKLLKIYNLFGFHVSDGRYGSEPGWPDWCILGDGKCLYRELKDAQGTLSADQVLVAKRLRRAGQDFAVWRPADFISGAIREELAAIRMPVHPDVIVV